MKLIGEIEAIKNKNITIEPYIYVDIKRANIICKINGKRRTLRPVDFTYPEDKDALTWAIKSYLQAAWTKLEKLPCDYVTLTKKPSILNENNCQGEIWESDYGFVICVEKEIDTLLIPKKGHQDVLKKKGAQTP